MHFGDCKGARGTSSEGIWVLRWDHHSVSDVAVMKSLALIVLRSVKIDLGLSLSSDTVQVCNDRHLEEHVAMEG